MSYILCFCFGYLAFHMFERRNARIIKNARAIAEGLELGTHSDSCAGWSDPVGDFYGCSCGVYERERRIDELRCVLGRYHD